MRKGIMEPTVLAAIAVFALMVVTWLVSLKLHDVSIVDPIWGPAFVLAAAACAVAGEDSAGVRWLLLGMTAVWGLRLGWHLIRRKLIEPEEDRRYAVMRKRKGSSFPLWSLFVIFGFRGLLVVIVSLPIQFAAANDGASICARG